MGDRHTQFVCVTKPYCACVGHPTVWDECACRASAFVSVSPAGDRTVCIACGADMVRIDFETGEPVSQVESA